MKKVEVGQQLGGGISSGGFGAGDRDVFALEAAKVEAEKVAKEKAAKRKNIEEIRAILTSKEHSPFVKEMAKLSGGPTAEEEIEKMMKEDPRVRYILTKKYE
jgi:hypothetical protein